MGFAGMIMIVVSSMLTEDSCPECRGTGRNGSMGAHALSCQVCAQTGSILREYAAGFQAPVD